jgi:hypothetical protein
VGALMEAKLADRGTGVAVSDWLHTCLMDCQWRTAQPPSARVIFSGPAFLVGETETDLFQQVGSTSDPGAQKRFTKNDSTEMAKSLSGFVFVAKRIIPELRNLTAGEQDNLKLYYQRLYRKA